MMSGSSSSPATLEGAAVAYSRTFPTPQVMQIRLHNSVFKNLLSSIQSNQPPHLIFGPSQALEVNGQTIPLLSVSDRFPNEIYRFTDGDPKHWQFQGVQSHTLTVLPKKKSDPSLEALKHSLVQSDLAKKAKSTLRVDVVTNRTTGARTLTPRAPNAAFVPSSSAPITSPTPASAQASRRKAMMIGVKYAIIHLLAAKGPLSASDIRRALSIPENADADFVTNPLKLVALPIKPGSEAPWKLKDRSYRDLQVWKFLYESNEVRQLAIDHAVKAYDRLRIPSTDPIWQLLLPEEERNKGKVLSRLQFNLEKPTDDSALAARPAIDKNTGLPRQQKKKIAPTEKDKPKEKDVRSSTLPTPMRPTSPDGPKAAQVSSRTKKPVVEPVSSKPLPMPRPSKLESSRTTATQSVPKSSALVKKPISPHPKSPIQNTLLHKSLPVKRKVVSTNSGMNRPTSSSSAAGGSALAKPSASKAPIPSPTLESKKPRTSGATGGRSVERTGAGVSKASTASKSIPKSVVAPKNSKSIKSLRENSPTITRRPESSFKDPPPSAGRKDNTSPVQPRNRESLKPPPANLKRKPEVSIESPRQSKVRKINAAPVRSPRPLEPSRVTAGKKSTSEVVTRKAPAAIPSPISSSSPVDSSGSTFSKNIKSSTSMSSSVSSDDSISRAETRNEKSEIDRAEEFRVKYESYRAFYSRLQAKSRPTDDEMNRLHDIQETLRIMKEEIWAAAEKRPSRSSHR